MSNDYYDLIDDYDAHSEYDKATIYDFEVYKPLMIEKSIKESRLDTLKDDIFIYCWEVERVLGDKYSTFNEDIIGKQVIKFLQMSIEQNRIDILKALWEFGIKNYLAENKKFNILLFKFVSDLIQSKADKAILEYFAKKIPKDSFFVKLDSSYSLISISGEKRQVIYGNLLAAAVLYANEYAIDIFLDNQPGQLNGSLKNYLNEDTLITLNYSIKPTPPFFFINNNYLKDDLCSYNPVDYALETGNIDLLEKLIRRGFCIDFDRDDFWYNIAHFGSQKIIEYLKRGYKEEFEKINLGDILMSANYLLLDERLKKGEIIPRNSFNLLFLYATHLRSSKRDDVFEIKRRNIKKCLRIIISKGVIIEDLTTAILFALKSNDLTMLRLVQDLHPKDKDLDLTDIMFVLPENLKTLSNLSESINLLCNVEKVNFFSTVNLRTFQSMLKIIDFRFEDKSKLSLIAKSILDLNLKSSVRILYKYDFLNNQNYKLAIDYILTNNLENIIQPFIVCFQEEGGIKRNYDL